MKKQLLPFLFLLIPLLLTFKATANEKLELLKDQAFKALDEKEYSQSREAFNALIRDYPDSAALLGLCYNNLGAIDIREGFNTRAIGYTQKALEQFRKTGIDTLIAKCLYNNGLVYKQLGQYEKAVQSLIGSLDIFETNKESIHLSNLSEAYNVLGNILKTTQDFKKALMYHGNAIKVAKELEDSTLLSKYLNNRGRVYLEMEFFNEAIEDFQSALVIKLAKKLYKSSAYTYFNLGETELTAGNLDQAEMHFLSATKINTKYNNKSELADCYNYLGSIYTKKKLLTKATSYLDKAFAYIKELNASKLLITNYQFQEELYEQTGDFKKALLYNKMYLNLYKQILSKEKQKAINESQIKYEVEKKENENKLLYQEAEIQLLKIKQQESSIENWRLISLIFILLVVFTALLGYRYYQVSQKEKKLADREKHLNQEQHHRIKNHLQALEGLLSFQQRKIEKGDVQEVIQESKNRITVVSQLHRNFYQNENSSSLVQLDTYLKGIIENLQLLFNRKELRLIFHLSPVQLAADKVLPLGLICNEVVNNAFKYGLSNKAKAVLEVQLRKDNKQITLSIKDNGPGYDPTKNPGGLGSELIQQLTRQLDGKMSIQRNSGTSYTLVFSV